MLYLVTFSCYGCHLPGDARGSFDHVRNGEHRLRPPHPGLEESCRRSLRHEPFVLSMAEDRTAVRDAILELCRYRGWYLCALHVRTTHVHGIVEAPCPPRFVLHDWKAYASRRLRNAHRNGQAFWCRGGNVRRVLTAEGLTRAMEYVLRGQGEPLEMYWADPSARSALI